MSISHKIPPQQPSHRGQKDSTLAASVRERERGDARVGGALGCVDELVSEALGDGLDVPEGALARTRRQQVDRLVHAAQRRDVHCLPPDHSSRANPCGVLTWAAAHI